MTVSQQRPQEIIYDEESHRQRPTRESNISNKVDEVGPLVFVLALLLAVILFFATGYTLYRILPPMHDYSMDRYLETLREL
jgi:hypothetical protein